MPQLEWLPERAGGINLWEDVSSIPMHQMVQLDNYYPIGKRWQLIQGNDVVSPGTTTPRVRHLMEYQADDGGGGTTKYILEVRSTTNTVVNAETGTALTTSGTITASQTALFDHTVFQGILLFTNGLDAMKESSNGTSWADTSGSPPSPVKYVEAWKNRVFLSGRNTAVLSVYYSADGDRTTWTGTDAGTEVITSPVGDYITGIRSVENYLMIFTRRAMTVLLGDHPDDWTKRTLFEDHGCSSHRTIAKVNGGLVYANDFGVWMINADLRRQELSKDIRSYWAGDSTNALGVARNLGRSSFMHAVYDPTPDKNRYYIWVSEGSSTKEDVCWIFHFNTGEWSRMTSFMDANQTCQASCLREDSSGNIQIYFAAGADDNTTNDKRVYKISNALSFASKTGGNIAATLKTGILHGPYIPQAQLFGLMTTKKWVDIFAKLSGTTTASQSVSFVFRGYSTDAAVDQRTITQTFTSATASTVRPRVPISVRGWGLQITMTYTGQIRHSFLGGIFNFEDAGQV